MKVLVITTKTNDTEKLIGSLECIGHQVSTIRYDQKLFNNMDPEIMAAARTFMPQMIVYIGSRWGQFLPGFSTFRDLRKIGPTVHLCSDGGDPPWWDLIEEYAKYECFDLQVNIDGCKEWPGEGKPWGLTALTPLDTRLFPGYPPPKLHSERPIFCGFAGATWGWRANMLAPLVEAGLVVTRNRDLNKGTYQDYCDFLGNCRVSLNFPDSGTREKKQVKGRIIESAYAGCLVFERQGAATKDWFEPDEEYWDYDPNRLADELMMFKNNLESSQCRAWRLFEKVRVHHNPEKFWQRVTERTKCLVH